MASSSYTPLLSTPFLILLITIGSVAFSGGTLTAAQRYNVPLAGIATCPNASLSVARTFRAVPGAKVEIVCPNSYVGDEVIRNTITDKSGVYSFSLGTLELAFNRIERCYIRVTLPPDGSCGFRLPDRAVLYPILAIKELLGRVLIYFPGSPVYPPARGEIN